MRNITLHTRTTFLALAVAAAAGGALHPGAAMAQTLVPAVRFHAGAPELARMADPDRYAVTGRLAEDARWVESRSERLVRWWEREGPVFLARAASFAGLTWPYRDIEVYLVRTWPVISIQYPLVVALDSLDVRGARAKIPEDEDFQVLVLAHQITHYLLDPPAFVPERQRPAAYQHPLVAGAGAFDREALVNWVTYAVLEEMWGKSRLERATGRELWRLYNPNHEFVVRELVPWRLRADRTLVQWLVANPRGSGIFRVRDAYARQQRIPEPELLEPTANAYGIELASTFEGRIFVATVDRASPADRAGVMAGDLLRTIEGRAAGSDVVDAQRRLDASWAQNAEINLSVERQGREVFVTVRGR